ncbi:MAG: hypothetical protein QM589_16125 [Thermomicrobiales bacterium]
MATRLTANPDKVLIDTQHHPTAEGKSTITYRKDASEELWLKRPGEGWTRPNLFGMIGTADADERGSFDVKHIKPGQLFQAGIFLPPWGPTSSEPNALAFVTVAGMEKEPVPESIITSMTQEHGGTYVNVWLETKVPTHLLLAAASQEEPTEDDSHVLAMTDTEGTFGRVNLGYHPLSLEEPVLKAHTFEITGLLPGREYYVGVIVWDDEKGRWDQQYLSFTLQQRKLTVKIDNLHVNDDGDDLSSGEGQFWIRVQYPSDADGDHIAETFHLPEFTIDSGQDYPLGHTHLGPLHVAGEQETGFYVFTWGSEDDDWPDGDDQASSSPRMIEFPVGSDEQVDGHWWHTNASPTAGSLSYYIEGSWWVDYEQA